MSRDETIRELEREMGVLIRRIRRVIHERARLVHPDLQPASYLMLTYLAESGPVRSSTIADVFGIDKGAISRQVQHLVDLGLVDRAPDPADGRATLLTVSDQARRRAEEVTGDRRRFVDERLGDWSAEELRTFTSALSRYNAALESELPAD
jgi:DNA-binding MarR family transcriptional regulator